MAVWGLYSPIPGAVAGTDCRFSVGVVVESRRGGPVAAELIPPHSVFSGRGVDVDEEVVRGDDLDVVILQRREDSGVGVWEVLGQCR